MKKFVAIIFPTEGKVYVLFKPLKPEVFELSNCKYMIENGMNIMFSD